MSHGVPMVGDVYNTPDGIRFVRPWWCDNPLHDHGICPDRYMDINPADANVKLIEAYP